MYWVIGSVLWILFGLIAYGGQFALCESSGCRQLYGDCVVVRYVMLATGPIGFVVIAISTKGFRSGLRFR